MMEISLVNKLYADGTLSALFKSGFVSSKVFEYYEIRLWVDAQIKTRSISKTKAVLEAEIKFKKSELTIWKALRAFY